MSDIDLTTAKEIASAMLDGDLCHVCNKPFEGGKRIAYPVGNQCLPAHEKCVEPPKKNWFDEKFKGAFFYEVQIGRYVFQWGPHKDSPVKEMRRQGLIIGKLAIWRDRFADPVWRKQR